MANVLIVEDEPLALSMLVEMIELSPGYSVIACADDLDSALRAAWAAPIDIAFVDINLARNSSGYSVAAKLSRLNINCIFVTSAVPSVPVPEFAVGCLGKPFTTDSVADALNAASGRAVEPSACTIGAFQRY